MNHLKISSALLSALMCMSIVMTPVAAMADETETPSETQTIETVEDKETDESEKPEKSEETTEQEPEALEDKGLTDKAKKTEKDAFVAKGKCGKKVKWSFNKKKRTLTISGKGAMKNYYVDDEGYSNTPWDKYSEYINKIVVSKGITTVGAYAFSDLTNVTSVSLPNSLKVINHNAFYDCANLRKVTIPKKVTLIGNDAFCYSGLKSIVIPKNVKRIGNGAFHDCNDLSSVSIYSNVIGEYAFYKCEYLVSVNIYSSVKTIGNYAFAECPDLTNVNIPIAGLSTIGDCAFDGCSSLKTISIPLSVTKLGECSFRYCVNLLEARIDKSLYDNSTDAFIGCKKMTKYFYPYAPIGYSDTYGGGVYTITYPEINGTGTVSLVDFEPDEQYLVVPSNVTIKGINYRVTRIERRAIAGSNINSSLKTVVIGTNVTSIADGAFSNCENLVSVKGAAGLKTIGTRAFENCPNLQAFIMYSKVLSKIGPYAFNGDKLLTKINLKYTTKLTKAGIKNSLKGSSVQIVKVKKKKIKIYKKIFKTKNCGKKVKVKK